MLRVLTIIFMATLLGCGRGGAVRQADELPQQEGNWFCEMAENAEEWACVQDAELARSPRPSRLPRPEPTVIAAVQMADSQALQPQLAPGLGEPPPPPPPAPSTMATTGASTPPQAEVPTHIRLAYQPEEPVALQDLPADFYAVQLLAMSSRERIESYVEDNQLVGMTAARVEKDGELYYLLILGVYETRELAEQASQDIPPPLHTREPWVRELGTLQQAMTRGDALAGGPLH